MGSCGKLDIFFLCSYGTTPCLTKNVHLYLVRESRWFIAYIGPTWGLSWSQTQGGICLNSSVSIHIFLYFLFPLYTYILIGNLLNGSDNMNIWSLLWFGAIFTNLIEFAFEPMPSVYCDETWRSGLREAMDIIVVGILGLYLRRGA